MPENRRNAGLTPVSTAFRSEHLTVTRNWIGGNISIPNFVLVPDDQFKFNLISKPSETSLLERIKAVVFDSKALSEACTKAFESVGATPIREQLAQHNLRFVTESVFMDPRDDDFWAPDQEFVDRMRSYFNSTRRGVLRLSTAADVSQTGDYKGLRYIGLTNAGIRGGTFPFSDTIIHSLLHSGGVPRLEGATTRVDLQISTEKHDEILKICGGG